MLAAIAEAQLEEGSSQVPSGLERLVRKSERTLLRRQESELTRRLSENDALIEARRISLRETHDRKVGQINARIQTLEAAGNTAITRLHMAQRDNQDQLLQKAMMDLEATRQGAMTVEPVAVCVVEIGR